MRRTFRRLATASLFAGRASVAMLVPIGQSFALAAATELPAPYVSRSLEAVLMPVNDEVRTRFGFSPSVKGVLVVSVQPGGTADRQHVEPGDIISSIHGRAVSDPIDLDKLVYYWLHKGENRFPIHYRHDGKPMKSSATITQESYAAAIVIAEVATWTAWTGAASFNYSEYYEEYASEITESYESSETTIEEAASSEEFSSENETESSSEEQDESVETDEQDSGSDDSGGDDSGSDDSGGDDSGSDDSGGDDSGGDDSGSDEE